MKKLKRLVFAVMLLVISAALSISSVNAGASQYPLAFAWQYPPTGSPVPLTAPLGKVIVNIPNHHNKLLVTIILQQATPLNTYGVGFNLFGYCTPTFGGVTQWGCQTGWIGYAWGTTIGIYPLGTITTDVDGSGDYHINLNDLPAGEYNIIFWVTPCSFPDCSTYPVASTGSWGVGPFVTVDIA